MVLKLLPQNMGAKVFCLLFLFMISSCGLKTDLVVYDDSAPEPQLSSISYQVAGNVLQLELNVVGGSGAVLYQVDRAEVEPDCQCVGHWLRYYVSSPSLQRNALKRNVKLRHPDKIYAFRVRVKDELGRSSAWSKVIKVKAE